MILRFVFSGLFGSFFLKKYIKQMYKINQISRKGLLVKITHKKTGLRMGALFFYMLCSN
jgi:hypothetical protein